MFPFIIVFAGVICMFPTKANPLAGVICIFDFIGTSFVITLDVLIFI